MKLRITLEITDPETVAEYANARPEIVADDILSGSLISRCDFVRAEMVPLEETEDEP